jgi:hypothetical protein
MNTECKPDAPVKFADIAGSLSDEQNAPKRRRTGASVPHARSVTLVVQDEDEDEDEDEGEAGDTPESDPTSKNRIVRPYSMSISDC